MTVKPRGDAVAGLDAIGGESVSAIREKAKRVEAAVYGVVGAIVAPPLDRLPPEAIGAYRPFDVIEQIAIETGGAEKVYLRPLVVFDDAHLLHREQFQALKRWLARRELKIARWIISRLDAMSTDEALSTVTKTENNNAGPPGITLSRDVRPIFLQTQDRTQERRFFRKLATDMAKRYMGQMPLFRDRGLTNLGALLQASPLPVPEGTLRELEADGTSTRRKLKIPEKQAAELRQRVKTYFAGTNGPNEPDVELVLLQGRML